jgi:cellulose biosynthesis protein BcsQ
MVRSDRPAFHFTERTAPDPHPGARGEAERSSIDRLLRSGLQDHVPDPYLTACVARHLVNTALPNLELLTPGAGGALTRELKRPLEALLHRLGRSFDIVLIDGPPYWSPGPTALLATLADAVLLVASTSLVRSTGLLRTLLDLRRGGATMVAVHAVRTGIP